MPNIDLKCNTVGELTVSGGMLHCGVDRVYSGLECAELRTQTCLAPETVEIVIIGGGIIGTGLAAHILNHDKAADVIIVDKNPSLLSAFARASDAISQSTMRSGYEHHIAPDSSIQLIDFARLHLSQLLPAETEQLDYALSHQRSLVPRDLFIAHATHVCRLYGLPQRSYVFDASSVSPTPDNKQWVLADAHGRRITARNVLFATGSVPREPPTLLAHLASLVPQNVHFPQQHRMNIAAGSRVAVIGNGLSAGHSILHALSQGCKVEWIIRDDDRYRCADFDTRYFRTEGLRSFQALRLEARENLISSAHAPSLMPEFIEAFDKAARVGQLTAHRNDSISSFACGSDGSILLTLQSGLELTASNVVVAIGYSAYTSILPASVLRAPITGLPVLKDKTLEIVDHPGLYACGALAQLSLGPAARVIDGARLAAQAILPSLFGMQRPANQFSSLRIRGTEPIGARKSRKMRSGSHRHATH